MINASLTGWWCGLRRRSSHSESFRFAPSSCHKTQDGRPVSLRTFLSARQIFPAILLILPLLAGLATEAEAQTVTISSVGGPINEGGSALVEISVNPSPGCNAGLSVHLRGRRADGSLYSVIAKVSRGQKSGQVPIFHNDDDIWHKGGHYDMPVWVAPNTEGCFYVIGAGSRESDTTWSVKVKDNDQISASFSGPGNVDSEEFSREQLAAVTFSPDPGRGNLPAVLNFKVSGTATEGEDYEFASTVTRNGDVYTSSGTSILGQRVIALNFIDDDVDEGTETIVLTLEPGADYVVAGEENQRTVEILDDEAPTTIYTLSLEASPLSADEPADEGDPNRDRLVTFAMTPAPTSSHIVNFMACFTGTASRNVDYQIADIDNSVTKIVLASSDLTSQPGCRRVIVYPGASSGSFKVRVSRDADFEADETVTITLKPLVDPNHSDTPGAFAVSATAGSVELVIVNDDEDPSLPALFFDPARRSRAENVGTDNLDIIFSSQDLASALTVNYRLGGTATCGTDYMITGADCTAGTGAFTFPANTMARTPVLFPITVIDDDISDNGETIIVTLTSTSTDGYRLPPGFPKTFTLTLYDDTGSAAISVSGTPRVGAPMTINWDSDDPDGNGSRDPFYYWQFRATSSDSWNDYQARQRGCGQRATTCRPTHSAGNPTVGGYFRGLASYTDGNGLGTTVLTNAIGPFTAAGPGIVLPATDVTLREGRTARYNLKLATDPGAGATVRVSITSGDTGAVTVNDTQSGVNGTQNYLDFTGGSGGSWNTHQAVTVRGVQDVDTTNEADVLTHAVSIQAGSSAPYTGLADVTLNVDVTDDDTLPTPTTPVVSITASPSSMTEGGTATFTLTANPAPTQNITVVINITEGVRFTGLARITRFIDTSGTRIFTVATNNDNRDEASGPVTATVGTGTGYVPHITEGSATVIVNDNDDPPPNRPVVSIGVSPSSMIEGGTATFTLTANPAPTASISVAVRVTDSGDFAGAAAGLHTVSIPSSGAASLTIATTDDGTDEPNGTITATVNTGTGYATHNTEWSASATVNDNDDPGAITPVVSITGSPSSMTEGGTATFTLTASPAPQSHISVSVQVTDSGDFATGGTGPRTVTVDTTGTASFTVGTTDDNTDEPSGTITATVNADTGYAPHNTNGSASVTVNDNDDPPPDTPVVSITASPSSLTEGSTATFTLTANPAPTGNISVAVTVAGGNFATSGARTVTVDTTGTASFTVGTDDDETDEPNGTITATVNTGTGYSPHNTNSRASVTVNDNDAGSTDAAPTTDDSTADDSTADDSTDDDSTDDEPIAVSTLALTDATVSEGESVTVRLTVTPPAPQALTITWRTQPGTATAGTDYPSEATGTVTIPAGAATATFTLATTADRIAEPSETFTVTLAGDLPAHVTVADGGATATITIEDDDIAGVTLTPATLHLSEAGETAPLTVRLTSQPTAAVTVTVTSAPAAVATVTPATLTFTAATWATPQPVTVTAGTAGAATLTLTLASADPGYATLTTRPAARVRVGADLAALTTPWLARFGRTVTGQAVTGLTTRLTATRTPGLTGSVAGLTLSRLGEEAPAANQARLAPSPDVTPDPRRNPGGRLLTGRDLLAGSAFALTSAPTATGGSYALWGQGAWTHFAGHTGAQAVNGEVLSGTLGVDWAQGPWVLGVAVSHTQGEGDATERTHHGTVQSSLTLVTPYVGLDVTDHVTLWGTVGYGRGTLTLTLPTEPEVATDTALLLATGGLRGRLREPDSTGGLALAVRSEARFLRTQAEAVAARGLADSEADVGLLRLGLEGAWHQPLAEGGAVIPRLDFGLRQDAGDAEQGFGVEVRGGVRWEAPAHGVTLDLAGQTLLAHSDQGFETWGGAATVQWDPAPGSAAGPALVLRQTYGSVGAGGSPTFWTDAPVALLASPGPADLRVTADFGWGLPLTAGLGVPHVTYGWAPTSRELALGWRLLPNRARDLTLDLTTSHREARRTVPVRQVTLSLTRTW